MATLDRVSVYRCPKGAYEESAERAMAWHIVDLSEKVGRDGIGAIDFSDALTVVKNRRAIVSMLQELDVQ